MSESFLKNDAFLSIEEIKQTLSSIGISSFYVRDLLYRLGSFLSRSYTAVNDEQNLFISQLMVRDFGSQPQSTFNDEIKRANWFIPHDSYIKLSMAISNIVDYVTSISSDYCERVSKEIIRRTKETFLLPLQKENKGLSLVYLVRN